MASIGVYTLFQAFDGNGLPAKGWKLNTYDSGTLNVKATYSDRALSSANTNPVILNARGEANVNLNGKYKFILTDENDVPIWTEDEVAGLGVDVLDASATQVITFHAPISTPTTAPNKGFLYTRDVTGKAELHYLDEDDQEVQITSVGYLNDSGFAISGKIIGGDSTTGRSIRNNFLRITGDAAAQITVKFSETNNAFNPNYVAEQTGLTKGATLGGYSLNAGGDEITILNAGFTGDIVSVLGGSMSSNSTGTIYYAETAHSATGLSIKITDSAGVAVDTTGFAAGKFLTMYITYITSA